MNIERRQGGVVRGAMVVGVVVTEETRSSHRPKVCSAERCRLTLADSWCHVTAPYFIYDEKGRRGSNTYVERISKRDRGK